MCAHGFLHLLHYNIPFVWNDQTQKKIDALKNALTLTLLNILLDLDKDYNIYVSMSASFVVGGLNHEGEDGREHIIALEITF